MFLVIILNHPEKVVCAFTYRIYIDLHKKAENSMRDFRKMSIQEDVAEDIKCY